MIIENKKQRLVVLYGRITHDLPNSTRLKSFITRDSTVNHKGRQSLAGLRKTYGELLIQVLHNTVRTDNVPQVFLIEITDIGINRYLVGRFSIKKQQIQPRILWSNIDSKITKILDRYYSILTVSGL